MRLGVGILCHNQLKNHRAGLFDDTLKSIRRNNPDVLLIADNGSTDGTTERLAEHPEFVGFPRIEGFPPANTCGYGMNKLAATLRGQADIVVLSNDDIIWEAGAFDTLKEVWAEAPDELTIISGLVEGTYRLPDKKPWNEPFGVAEVSDHKVLLRRSVPGGAWSYRSRDHDLIFPVSTFPGVDDVPACHKLIAQQRGVGAIDLAEHAGEENSTWGNGSDRFLIETRTEVFERFGL